MAHLNRRIVLASRPEAAARDENFRLDTVPAPVAAEGQVLLRTRLLSLDPYMRWRMNAGRSYAKPVEIGDVMVGATVCDVAESRHPEFSPGETVLAAAGWQDYSVSDGTALRTLDPGRHPVSTALGVLGSPGLTAYTGLLNIGRPRSGETVVVAAATGPVGSAVGQIARIKGCRTVAIAGGAEKCRHALHELGFDAAIDHRAHDLPAALAAACPHGIDVYFENVGGRVWEAVLPLLNDFARVPVCGLVSQYDDPAGAADDVRVSRMMRDVLTKRFELKGFIVTDFVAQRDDFLREVGGWIDDGLIRYRETVVDGLERAPDAFLGLLEGRHTGKLIIRVA